MYIALRSLWFILTILLGILAGLWARQLTTAPAKASLATYPKPEAAARPKPIARPAITNKVNDPLTIEEMDAEVKNAPRNDRRYMLVGWFGGDYVRQGKAESLAMKISNGQYDWPRDNHRRDFLNATTEENKRRIYRDWSRQRIYSMTYILEVAKEANLLMRPGDRPLPPAERPASGGVNVSKQADAQAPAPPPKTFQ
jgi:hypothetical protein